MSCATTAKVPKSFLREGVIELDSPLPLARSGALFGARVAYHLSGPPEAPTVLVMGGISAHRQAGGDGGWWPELVGVGRALDPTGYRILGFDWIGGCGESTRAGGPQFPLIDSLDQAAAAVHLLDALGIDRVAAVIGASYGGQVAQQLLRHHPERLERGLVICAAHRPYPLAVALRSIQRRILRAGIDNGQERDAVALARELAMLSYRSGEELDARFGDHPTASEGLEVSHPIESYLAHCGDKFARRFGPWPYLRLSQSIDLHQVEPARITAPFELVGFRPDLLVPPEDLVAFRQSAPNCEALTLIDSRYGHDGFLKESARLTPIFERILGACPC